MKRTLIAGLAITSALLTSEAAWQDFTDENYICGPKLTAESLKDKVVLVDMWAIWCGPCRRMMPHTEAIAKKYKDHPFVVIGSHVNSGYSKEKVEKFIKDKNFTFSFYKKAGWDGNVGFDGGIPFLYVIDKKGNVTYGGRNTAAVEKAIEAALGIAAATGKPQTKKATARQLSAVKCRVDLLKCGIVTYMLSKGTDIPPTDLHVLLEKNSRGESLISGGESSLVDPWKKPYRLEIKGKRCTVISDGPDGLPGTEDDIRSDKIAKKQK